MRKSSKPYRPDSGCTLIQGSGPPPGLHVGITAALLKCGCTGILPWNSDSVVMGCGLGIWISKKLSQVILLGNSGYDLLPCGKGSEMLVHKRIIWRAFWNADSRASSSDLSTQQLEMEPEKLQFKKYSRWFWCGRTSDLESHFLERFAIFMVLSFPTFKHGILAIYLSLFCPSLTFCNFLKKFMHRHNRV